MAELDQSCVLTPLSPTYMPYFPPHHSPLHSSSNTRQRDDYESCSHPSPPPRSPQVLVTLTDEDDYDDPPSKPDRLIEGYPAWELPFASEPALEGELEQGLPPLKKLKPDNDPTTPARSSSSSSPFDKHSAEGIVLIGAVKGILTRRAGTPADSTSMPHSPSASSPISSDTSFVPWPRSLGLSSNSLTTTHLHSSAPLSRRSSSGASSICAGSLKAVRFASGNGFTNCWGATGFDQTSTVLPGEVEGPVAAVMYLTHSAEAYDRSPIIVEDGLRLPPRAKQDDDDDDDVEEEQVVCQTLVPPKRITSPEKKRQTKMNLRISSAAPHSSPCTSPLGLSPSRSSPRRQNLEAEDESKDCEEETSIIMKPSNSTLTMLTMSKTYREKADEVDEEEEDEKTGPESIRDRDDEDEDVEDDEENQDDEDDMADEDEDEESNDDDDNDDDRHRRRRRHHSHREELHSSLPTRSKHRHTLDKPLASPSDPSDCWGLGKWSTGEVFGSCDALGGF